MQLADLFLSSFAAVSYLPKYHKRLVMEEEVGYKEPYRNIYSTPFSLMFSWKGFSYISSPYSVFL